MRFRAATATSVWLSLAGCNGCRSTAPPEGAPADGGGPDVTAADADADSAARPDWLPADDSVPPWDAAWHVTTPAAVEAAPGGSGVSCGPGCRALLGAPVAARFPHGHDPLSIVDSTPYRVVFVPLGASPFYVPGLTASGTSGFVAVSVRGRKALYVRSAYPAATVELADVDTGERKAVYAARQTKSGDGGVLWTGASSTHAYFVRDRVGLVSRNLATGELRLLSASVGMCDTGCATETGVLCAAGKQVFVGNDGSVTTISEADGMQVDGACAPDRKRWTWIDYRDPPGPNATFDFNRTGGEVYVSDLGGSAAKRVTFDSPGQPRGKVYPAVDGDFAVWNEPGDSDPANPDTYSKLLASANAIGVVEISTLKRCRITPPSYMHLEWKSLHGRHLVAHLAVAADGGADTYLVEVDLDDPALPCVPVTNGP